MDSAYQTTYSTGNAEVAAAGTAMFSVFALFYLAFAVFLIISLWKLFVKAGKPGWAALIPIYNIVVMLEIVGRPVWWVLLIIFVPLLNVWLTIVMYLDLAKSFGKSLGFGIVSLFFPYVTIPILAFGKSQYQGPVADGLNTMAPAPERTTGFATVAPTPPAAAAPAPENQLPPQPPTAV